jgi:hypothetical protein
LYKKNRHYKSIVVSSRLVYIGLISPYERKLEVRRTYLFIHNHSLSSAGFIFASGEQPHDLSPLTKHWFYAQSSLLQTQWTSHRRRPLERQPQTISSWLERVTCTAQAPNPGVPTLDGNTRTMDHLRNRLKNPAPALKTNRQGYKKACDLFVRGGDGPFIKWNEI